MHETIYNNNQGVGLFNAGDFLGAIDAFQRGVDAILASHDSTAIRERRQGSTTEKAAENLTEKVSFPASARSHPEILVRYTTTLPGDHEWSIGSGTTEAQLVQVSERTNIFVFNRPILLKPHEEADLLSPVATLVSSVVLLLNYALVCHHYSLITGSEILLRRAAQLYNLTLSILPSGHPDGIFGLAQCLALNNLAQVYDENCDHGACHDCLECLCEVERRWGCLSSSTAAALLLESEYNQILLNMTYETHPQTAKAA